MSAEVALINMPWSTIRHGSLALAILKRVLRRKRITSDTFYFNLHLARRMNLRIYENISSMFLVGDWLFSQHLFGEFGTREIHNSLNDLLSETRPGVKDYLDPVHINFDQIARKIIPEFINECLNRVEWSQYSVIGFTSVFTQHLASLLLARKIKQLHPQVKIVFGGANVEGDMGREMLRSFDWIDYVVDGEAEQSFPLLVKNILAGKSYEPIAGISFRKGEKTYLSLERLPMTRLNKVPIPDYSDFFREVEAAGLKNRFQPYLMFESARGCWWGEKAHCVFCGLNGQTMAFRAKSAQRVIREIETLSRRHSIRNLDAVDNILDKNFFSTLIPKLAARKLGVQLFYEVKANLTEQQLDLLVEAGVNSLQPGIESLHTEVLKLIRKGITALHNIQLLKWCRKRNIHVSWNLLYGFTGETAAHYEQILQRMYLVTHFEPPQHATKIVVQRYSPYFFDAERFGITNIQPLLMYAYTYPPNSVNLDNIAYHFNYSVQNADAGRLPYLAEIRNLVKSWKKLFEEKRVVFEYRKHAHHIELIDSRPLPESGNAMRKTVLRDLKASLYEFCDSNQTFAKIYHHAKQSHGTGVAESEVRAALQSFVDDGLMYSEGERYLSLALRAG